MEPHSESNQLTDIRKEQIPVSSLSLGMFVCELDRPWLGTPFLLEGVLIEDEAQIATLATLCEFVYIDRTVSLGPHYLASPKKPIAIKRNVSTSIHQSTVLNNTNPTIHTQNNKINTHKEQRSFFNIIREIQDFNQSTPQTPSTNNTNINLSYLSQDAELNTENNPTGLSLSKQIKADLSNFVLGLKGWRQSWKKKNNHITSQATQSEDVTAANKINYLDNTVIEEKYPIEQEITTIYPIYEKTQLVTQAFFNAMAENQLVDLSKVDEALNDMVDSIERNSDALVWLARLKQTDDYSYNHALNVSITLMALANFMALPKKQIKDLGLAGLLQDIGKVKIPKDLLQKKEKITAEEFEVFKKHVDHALALLEVTNNISSTTMITVSQHHERIDGSGYPYQLKGKQISLTGQMSGLIDTYCALTSNKAYAKSVYNQFALEKIHVLRDTKFDGRLIDQLVQFLGMYPVSSLVELNSGEVGVVIQQNSVRRLLPKVMILLNPDKTKNEYPPTLNLINLPLTPSGEPYKIVRGLPPDSYGLNINNYFS
ncbi:MAG: HD-GYP domain-containing protein [Methylotenera sp.]|uniref:HD-GYP domain-containing protein n=1 Tax=Methylotenera sp. TaxID=2051956 RepID=UPI00271D2A90|nr:HD-GYP domain-containing protein [Methylotenera sp.]MDO9151951.1 HD-GYP domain-containing protein [Methylotenera sp.]